MTDERREGSALGYEHAAELLETAARHCRTAAQHLRSGEIPRAGAHAWAAFGHLREADDSLSAEARTHAHHSIP